jgi:hypothetical protein
MPYFGVYRGRLTDVSELAGAGRVRVSVPAAGVTSAAAPVVYSCLAEWSLQIGAVVVVAFDNGDNSRPIVLGQVDS